MATSIIKQSGISYKGLTTKYDGNVGVTSTVFTGTAQNDGVCVVECQLSSDSYSNGGLYVDGELVFGFGTVGAVRVGSYCRTPIYVQKGSVVSLSANQSHISLASNINFA